MSLDQEEIEKPIKVSPDDLPVEFADITNPNQRLFLAALCEDYSVTRAAKAAGFSRMAHYKWMQTDEAYAKAAARAKQIGLEAFEDIVHERATLGRIEDVYGSLGAGLGTGVVGKRRVPSDTLAIFKLKAELPEKYGDRMQHQGPGGGPLQIEVTRRVIDVPAVNDLD